MIRYVDAKGLAEEVTKARAKGNKISMMGAVPDDKESLIRTIYSAVSAPKDSNVNWDALKDVLSAMGGQLLCLSSLSRLDPHDREILEDVVSMAKLVNPGLVVTAPL